MHFQYNGWFVFFLSAFAIAQKVRLVPDATPHRLALPLLVSGVVLTYAISTLWLGPSILIRLLSALGSALQLGGTLLLALHLLPKSRKQWFRRPTIPQVLIVVTASGFSLKCLLQLASSLPALAAWSGHRFIVIAFLHLVFLLVILPALFAIAWQRGWIANNRFSRASLALLFAGILLLEFSLVLPVIVPSFPLSGQLPEIFLIAALLKVIGIGGVLTASFGLHSD